MQIALNETEKAAYSNAVESGLFDEDTILKHMIDTYGIELVELAEEDEDGMTEGE